MSRESPPRVGKERRRRYEGVEQGRVGEGWSGERERKEKKK